MHSAQISAKIYQFPTRSRVESIAERRTAATVDPRVTPAVEVMSGSSWYHEAAMQDAQRKGKH